MTKYIRDIYSLIATSQTRESTISRNSFIYSSIERQKVSVIRADRRP